MLCCNAATANAHQMSRMVLQLLMIVTLAIGNLHSPAMLHAEEADHAHHVETASPDHEQIADNQTHDMERGTLAHDHHGPTAMTVAWPGIELPENFASDRYHLAVATELRSWPIAPPPEPPSA